MCRALLRPLTCQLAAHLQMGTAIGLGMLFIVVNKSYEFLGDASVWIIISVGR